MNKKDIIDTARTLVAADKGLLAMDESNPTCNKRFARLGISQTEEARRPCTFDDLHHFIGIHVNEINKYLGTLEANNKIETVRLERGVFYELKNK